MLSASAEGVSNPVRPTIHVNDEDVSNLHCTESTNTAAPPPSLRVSFTGSKRSDLSLFRASSPAVSENQVYFLYLYSTQLHRY